MLSVIKKFYSPKNIANHRVYRSNHNLAFDKSNVQYNKEKDYQKETISKIKKYLTEHGANKADIQILIVKE
ncbi:hypothetical protein BCR32DRAFT_278438 [Anaeromyces robustus]|uniref:Uncharacterized protein n=1 Tax=Anaeromyces robustus TaxID=1754192 RepID=A0A1Y1XB79_9FUNG|nr:hypothetical protein BCR32DRAFT_278438 [Anaeromyces robustus]|eukprot:ORX82977.1 hypothetical protein BCR32DRAFT_278438 [Anaeromyces robustus]